jgi:exopolyphosphatase/guanosine-5'-triphosphate,3'-diphosphate pyrophosphatase
LTGPRLRSAVVRTPPPAKFGAIDVGTNSIHLVMAEISPEGDILILGRDKEMVLLGKGGFSRHVLTARAMNDGLAALQRFTKMAHLKGIGRLKAVATSAVREATNGGRFVERVRGELGLELHVISVEEEARLIYLAVRHAIDLGTGDNLILDIGGGSIELIVGNAQRPELLLSVKLGASRLGELFVRSDPPEEGEIKALRKHIDKHLAPMIEKVGRRTFGRCIVTSGTTENIARACAYRRGVKEIEASTSLRISRAELKGLAADWAEMKRSDRAGVEGIDVKRVDAVVPGAILLLSLMQAFDVSEVEHCDMALREGIILDHIAQNRAHLRARAMWPDPRLRSVVQLAERCGYRQAHAEQVTRLALSLFDQLAPLHELEPRFRELLRFSCLLHDIGYLISHQGHHKHSYYLIRNGGLQGFDEQEIEFIANVARDHRKGLPRKSHYSLQNLDKHLRPALRRLIPLLRIANALDRTHDSVVDGLEVRLCRPAGRGSRPSEDAAGPAVAPQRVELHVHVTKDAELELWTARRRCEPFVKEYGLPVEVQLAAHAVP